MKKIAVFCLLFILIIGFATMVRPFKEPLIEEAGSNETLFLIPLEGDNIETQDKLQSENYLEEQMVASKRVELDQRWLNTGRLRRAGRWIPQQQVITVDRTPVNLEWTSDSDRGSSDKNQGIISEDKNSISFGIDWYITATIKEDDAYKYLYWYGIDRDNMKEKDGYPYSVKARPLKDVVDKEVRRMVASLYNQKAGKLGLKDIMDEKERISNEINEEVIEHFKQKGITITASGWTGDMTYFDNSVQNAINEEFKAEKEREAQSQRNEMKIEIAEAERDAAEERQKMWDIVERTRQYDIMDNYIEMLLDKDEGWLPRVLLQPESGGNGQPFMLDIPMPENLEESDIE